MYKQIFRGIFIVVLLCTVSTFAVEAQVNLDATYTSHDGSFAFNYPYNNHTILDDESYVGQVQIAVPLYGTEYNINVFLPWLTRIQISGAETLQMARIALANYRSWEAARIETNVVQSHPVLEFTDETGGFWVLIEIESGIYSMVGIQAHAQPVSRVQNIAREVAASMTYTYPVIQAYDRSWETVIMELQSRHIIGDTGHLVFSQPAYQSDWEPLSVIDEYEVSTNVVMSAQMTVMGDAECGLLAHVQPAPEDDMTDLFSLRLVLTSQGGNITAGYRDDYGVVSRHFDFPYMDIKADIPHNYLFITEERTLSIYVDGNPLVEHVPIAPVAGDYGLYFTPLAEGSQCLVSNFWVYEHDAPLAENTCTAVITTETEGRLWPASDRIIRHLHKDDAGRVVCHYTVEANNLWYLLSNGAWIPASNARLLGDCSHLLTIH